MTICIFRTAVAAFLTASFVCSATLAAEPKRVMVLHSFGRDFKPWSEYAKAIRMELDRQSPWPMEIIDHSLMSARSADENPEVPFVEYLRALSAKRPADLIVSIGAPAASFVQRHRQQLFPSTPMVLTGVEVRRIQRSGLTENDVVVAGVNDFRASIENILHVLPDTKTVAFVLGDSPNERVWLDDIRRELEPLAGRVSIIWYNDRSFADILKHAASLPPHSAIFWGLMNVDAAGVVHEGDTGLPRLYDVANAPIFTYNNAFFGREIVGGPMHSVLNLGRDAAAVVVRILGGEKAGDIKIAPRGYASPIFDWRLMQRWGISERNLPPGSEVRFRPATMWQQYSSQMSVIFAALLLQAALIGWLLLERRRRHLAELESRGRLREIIHLDRVAAVGAMSASISHELNQPLGAILSNAETAKMLLAANPVDHSQLKEILDDILQSDQRATEIIAHLRGLLKKQGEAELPEFDLNDAIRDALLTLGPEARKRGVLVSAHQVQGALPVRADRVHLEQVILNLAINAMDAMQDCAPGTRKMTVQTVLAGSSVEVSVSDSGMGIPSDKLKVIFDTFHTTKQHGTGLGLSIVRTIVENSGGKVWAENRPGGGAVFRFTLPLAKTHKASSTSQ